MAGMTTYHISKKTYQPAPCTARPGHCPLKGQHYPTMAQAQAVAEAALSKQYGQTISLSKNPTVRFYNAIDAHPNSKKIHRNIRILKRVGKGTMIATVLTVSATMALARFTASAISGKKMSRGRRKINAKKLLGTKYWLPDIHSNKWR